MSGCCSCRFVSWGGGRLHRSGGGWVPARGVGLAALARDADGLAAWAGLASLVAGAEDRGEVPGPERSRACPRPRSPAVAGQDPGDPFAGGARLASEAGRGSTPRPTAVAALAGARPWSWSSAR